MCFFIVVGIPRSSATNWNAILPDQFHMWPTHYKPLEAMLTEYNLFNVVQGQCSCDLFKEHKDLNERALQRRYKKKGWSAEKIQRTIIETRKSHGLNEGMDIRMRTWVASIAEHEQTAVVFVHWDSDALPEHATPVVVQSSELRKEPLSVSAETITMIKAPLTRRCS
jgi:hypothetical protein